MDENNTNNTTMAVLVHILGLMTSFIGPLVIYVSSTDEFTKQNAAKALNWQIMFIIYMIISFILSFVVIGFIGLILFPLIDTIACVIAAVRANEGEVWDYPITINFVK